jgi:proton-translocating NADH-quinone oxidoreductase chain L
MFISSLVFLPLFSFLGVGVAGRLIGRKGAVIITTVFTFLSFLISCFVFYKVTFFYSFIKIDIISWIRIGIFEVSWSLLFDSVTVVMLLAVTFVSTLVHLYSYEYMQEDPHLPRFMAYLSLFTFFMLMLVTSSNFAQMFLGWEGVGLASYLLISFWHTRKLANNAALKAIVVNRVGDFGLGLGIFAIYHVFQSLDFSVVIPLADTASFINLKFLSYEFNALNLITLLLFVGAVGKSAQLGLHTWLPDAMEGPTPVSALIHAATMVTAGVFVLVRCSPIIHYAAEALAVITVIGGLTAFFAATTGTVQNDLKRVIAYSTCSQLGYMVFACGMSSYSVSIFHLMNHAFFKALLFLGAGCVIHAIADEQDMRKMGGLLKSLPLTYSVMLVGSLSLMGFPFLTGFYSKDLIIEIATSNFILHGGLVYSFGVVAAFFTAFYSLRLLYLTFFSFPNSFKSILSKTHEPFVFMIWPLIFLTFGSIFVGYIFKDMMVGLGSNFWNNSISFSSYFVKHLDSEFLPSFIKLSPTIVALLGAFISYFIYTGRIKNILFYVIINEENILMAYRFFSFKWLFDQIYNDFIINKIFNLAYKVNFVILDRGFIETYGPKGISQLVLALSKEFTNFQSGYIHHYATIMVLGVLCLSTLLVSLIFDTYVFGSIIFIPVISLLIIFFIKNDKVSKNEVEEKYEEEDTKEISQVDKIYEEYIFKTMK